MREEKGHFRREKFNSEVKIKLQVDQVVIRVSPTDLIFNRDHSKEA